MENIAFDECSEMLHTLDGASQKTRIVYEGKHYILKYGETISEERRRPLEGSYKHSHLAEWLACHIVHDLDLPVQNTLLGTYHGRKVVACEDFVIPYGIHHSLVSFSNLESQIISSSERGRKPHLENLKQVFAEHPYLNSLRERAEKRYWETFVVDAIIGNFDRHAGNWGYISEDDPETGVPQRLVALAPIYDCGSSCAPKLSEIEMEALTNNQSEMKKRALTVPKACLVVGDNYNIGFGEFMLEPEGKQAREALMRLAPKIKELNVEKHVKEIPDIVEVRRRFYVQHLVSRIQYVLQPAYDMANDELGLKRSKLLDYTRYYEPKDRTNTHTKNRNMPKAAYETYLDAHQSKDEAKTSAREISMFSIARQPKKPSR